MDDNNFSELKKKKNLKKMSCLVYHLVTEEFLKWLQFLIKLSAKLFVQTTGYICIAFLKIYLYISICDVLHLFITSQYANY